MGRRLARREEDSMENKAERGERRRGRGSLVALLSLALALAAVALAGLLPPANGMTPWGLRERSSRYVRASDGTRLAVRLLLPRGLRKGQKLPAVVELTRYDTWYRRRFLMNLMVNLGLETVAREPELRFLGAGYAFVAIDARGSGASFGARPMECSREEVADYGELVDWICAQPWSNGRVASYGVSYSANTAELAASTGRSGLAAALALYPDFDVPGEEVMPGGIHNKYLSGWSASNIADDSGQPLASPLVSGVAPVDGDAGGRLLKEAQAGHRTIDLGAAFSRITYFDEELAPGYGAEALSPYAYREAIERGGVPLYVRVGWMDGGTVNGALERFLSYSNPQCLVIGPWSHAGWHFYDPFLESKLGTPELDSAQSSDMIAFLDPLLKGPGKGPKAAKLIRYYTLGEGAWKAATTWPVPGFERRTLYLGPGKTLRDTRPGPGEAADRYQADFGATTGTSNRWHTNFGGSAVSYPDRANEDRKILAYTGEPLGRDIEITGNPVATLELSSSAADGAFYVYLEDVAPDGRVSYLTEGELRALHRKLSPPDPRRVTLGPRHSMVRADGAALVPGEVAELRIGMYATSALLRKGHRIRLAIACADSGTFERIPEEGPVSIELRRDALHPSSLEIPVKER
jgi:putative CocE/NonD family hydrolase